MKRRSKKYVEAVSKIDKSKVYSKEEAVKLVKETSTSSFDGSVDASPYDISDPRYEGSQGLLLKQYEEDLFKFF